MVGYSLSAKAYRLYDPDTKKIVEKRDVIFDESRFVHRNTGPDILMENCETSDDSIVAYDEHDQEKMVPDKIISDNTDETEQIDLQPPMETEPQAAVKFGPGRPMILRSGKPGRPKKTQHTANFLSADIQIPNSFEDIANNYHHDKWKAALEKEYSSLIENNTWTLMELPSNQKVIKSKWVFSTKTNKDGEVERLKARLVAKDYSPMYGFNYFDVFCFGC